MFAWWGRTVVTARWWVLGAGLMFAIVGGAWGTGVFHAVVGGGFTDPGSESAKAAERIVTEVGQPPADVVSCTPRTAGRSTTRTSARG